MTTIGNHEGKDTRAHGTSLDEAYVPPKMRVNIRAALRIARDWGLTDAELGRLLGGRSSRTIRRWRSVVRYGMERGLPTESEALLDRLSLLIGVYAALHKLFPNAEQADRWIRRTNDAAIFEGQPALDYMLEGGEPSMQSVWRYLMGVSGIWCGFWLLGSL